jgi:PleD family two-component response regulator
VSQAAFPGAEASASQKVQVTVSIGVSLYGGDVKRFFNEADRALYRAKAEGKDCVVLYSE